MFNGCHDKCTNDMSNIEKTSKVCWLDEKQAFKTTTNLRMCNTHYKNIQQQQQIINDATLTHIHTQTNTNTHAHTHKHTHTHTHTSTNNIINNNNK